MAGVGAKQQQQQPLDLDFDDALLTVVSDPNFLLYPKITLSVDACELGQCGICHESQLLLRGHETIIDDQTVAILPCGHIAGYVCLSNWLDFKKSCPFCRFPLQYELCKHASKLIRPLTRETLYGVPDPIPTGGKIHAQCSDCSVATNRKVNQQLLDGFVERFKKLRAEYQAAESEQFRLKIKHAMAGVKRKMESTMQELGTPSAKMCIGW